MKNVFQSAITRDEIKIKDVMQIFNIFLCQQLLRLPSSFILSPQSSVSWCHKNYSRDELFWSMNIFLSITSWKEMKILWSFECFWLFICQHLLKNLRNHLVGSSKVPNHISWHSIKNSSVNSFIITQIIVRKMHNVIWVQN